MDRRRRLHALLQLTDRAHMINVGMRANDLLRRQPMLLEPGENFQWIVTGIDNDCFPRLLITQDRAVALQPAHRKCFDDQFTSPVPRLLLLVFHSLQHRGF